jgi:hypothetical protein
MKYHALPTPSPRQLDAALRPDIRHAIHELNRELTSTLQKLIKKTPRQHYNQLFYLHDPRSMDNLVHLLQEEDELVIHAEGYPFLIGPLESGPYVLTPFQLASLLNERKLPNIKLHINLLTCNSATDYNGSNFARDLSIALHSFFRHTQITVTGYTGFIEAKSNAKYAVSSVLGRSTKGTHAALDDAKCIYENNVPIFTGKVLIKNFSDMGIAWADPFIKQTQQERRLIMSTFIPDKKPPLATSCSLSSNNFFTSNHANDYDPLLNKSNSSESFLLK